MHASVCYTEKERKLSNTRNQHNEQVSVWDGASNPWSQRRAYSLLQL